MSARDVIAARLTRHVGHGITKDAWKKADAILAAFSAAGYAVVPREPTEAMIAAAPGRDQQATEESMYHGIYRAMLAAAEETGHG